MSNATLVKTFASINGRRMAYHLRGQGHPILFLHGNPTSSYLWRHVMAEMEGLGQLIAPDLIGMGDSEKLPDPGGSTYTYATHRDYLWSFIHSVIGERKLILVVHDWGSALGFEWARRHPDQVMGIAYMEALVRPFESWEEFPAAATNIFKAFRSPNGEDLALNQNMFVERVLPGSVLRALTAEEMEEYRRPFARPEDRWPTLTWPRQIPVNGEPADVATVMDDYAQWLSTSKVPKLFVNAEPGAILHGPLRDFCRTWPNQTEVTVPGVHFVQEDSGPKIGAALRDWIQKLHLEWTARIDTSYSHVKGQHMTDSETAESKLVVQSLYDCIATGDVSRFLATLHPQFEAELPGFLPWGGIHRGPDQFASQVLAAMASAIDVTSFKLRGLFGEGEKVFATATANALGTGQSVTIGEDWTVKDSKAFRLRLFYFDPTPVFGRLFGTSSHD